jgi:hypothetical protein
MSTKIFKPVLLTICLGAVISFSSCHRDDDLETPPPSAICGDINVDSTWTNSREGVDYIISCPVSVNALLTIEPGTEIEFRSGAGIIVEAGGSLKAVGNAANKITMRGVTDVQGGWKGIFIKSNNVTNEINHCVIKGGGQSSFDGQSTFIANIRITLGAKLKLLNSEVSKSGKYGLYTEGFDSDERSPVTLFSGNTFSNNAGYPISTLAATGNILDGTASVFTANGKQFIEFCGGRMFGNHTWKKAGIPYLVSGYTIAGYYTDQGNLIVEPGVNITFAADQGLGVGEYSNGYVKMVGSASEHITLTGESASPGAWKGICFQSTNTANKLSYVDISYGGSSSFTGASGDRANISIGGYSAGDVKIDNTTVKNSDLYGIMVKGGSTPPILTAVTYSGNAGDNYIEL